MLYQLSYRGTLKGPKAGARLTGLICFAKGKSGRAGLAQGPAQKRQVFRGVGVTEGV
jgi:hypothetical protein